MSNADKLKRRAVEYESKRQLDRAIASYLELFAEWDGEDLANIEVSLYNRAGDLMLREGRAADAIGVWERAVDLYADGGFLNNAIALCNKILRYAPNQTSVYYKLGRISAQKGFRGDAKKNFLEYADRKQRANDTNEALRALMEFADLCPEEDDIRQMVADQLTRLGRSQEALGQLHLLFERYEATGEDALAAATLSRMRAIDPDVEPVRRGPSRMTNAQGLVFLDLDDAPAPRRAASAPPPVASRAAPPAPPAPQTPAAAVAPPVAPAPPPVVEPPVAPPAPAVVPPELHAPVDATIEAPVEVASDAPTDPPLEAPLQTPVEAPPSRATAEWMAGFEPTRLADDEEAPRLSDLRLLPGDDALLGLEPTAFDVGTFGDVDQVPGVQGSSDADPEDLLGSSIATDLVFIDTSGPADAFSVPSAEAVDVPSELDVVLDPSELEGFAGLDFISTDDESAAVTPPEATPAGDPSMAAPSVEESFSSSLDDLIVDVRPDDLSVDGLAARVARDPSDWWTRRLLGERLIDAGALARGMQELEWAMDGLEGAGDLVSASDVADRLAALAPADVRLHQKRVEYAVRTSDRGRLIEAYLALAITLQQSGQSDKARVVFTRVSELAPDDPRPLEALRALDPPPPRIAAPSHATPAEPRRTTSRKRYTAESPVVDEVLPASPAPDSAAMPDDEFVSLGDWLREDDGPKSTRMVVDEEAPSGDEDADFRDMLRKFKQGVADNVDDGDHESHYDLGVAFKEMGLVDEAIAQFQKALRGASQRVRTYEALGQCFSEKGQTQVAMTILQRALTEPGVGDDQLVGVLYLLGDAAASLGRVPEAIGYFQRVFAVDIMFRDVGDRLNQLERGYA